jgi:hypothetical protein
MKKSAAMNRIIDVTGNNIAEHPQAICFIGKRGE